MQLSGVYPHEVVDRVGPGSRARVVVATRVFGVGLRGSIGDKVARASSTTLEHVVEPEPVSDLVHGGVALVVSRLRAAGQGGEANRHSVADR